MSTASISLGPSLSPREAAIDAIYRFLQALDDADENLLRSAFISDAIVDRSGLTTATGIPFPILQGISDIEHGILGTIGRMDTGHHVSNVRVKLTDNGEKADVTCYVLAQHCRPGEGPSPKFEMHLAMGSRYSAVVVKDNSDGLWKIEKAELHCLWSEGDLGVFRKP